MRNYPPENPNPMMDGNKFSIPDVANWSLPQAVYEFFVFFLVWF